jgi:hypothetical protein
MVKRRERQIRSAMRKREKRKKKKICVEGRERKRESGALIVAYPVQLCTG